MDSLIPVDRGGAAQPLLLARDLRKHFPVGGGLLGRGRKVVRAVDDLTFSVAKGETLGVVGESGCGKSTVARLLIRLLKPDRGTMVLDGDPVDEPHGITVNELRRQVQMVFQDSYASLNPRLTIAETLAFAPKAHGLPAAEARERVRDLLAKVGLDPDNYAERYPHELSGGQRQRVNIARALALAAAAGHPRRGGVGARQVGRGAGAEHAGRSQDRARPHLRLHQPRPQRRAVSQRPRAGDVSRQDRRARARSRRSTAIRSIPTRGRCCRRGRRWIRASAPRKRRSRAIRPIPIDPPSGCRFRTRCPFAEDVCARVEPLLAEPAARQVACHMRVAGSGHSKAVGLT